jgi:hypothetical protein
MGTVKEEIDQETGGGVNTPPPVFLFYPESNLSD